VSSKCFQLYYTCSDRLLAIALPSCSFYLSSPLTVTFPKLSVIYRPLYVGGIISNCCSCPCVFATGVQCKASAFGDDPRRMLKVVKRFGKHCSYHLQGEYVTVWSRSLISRRL
jgi:hypothetical protein